MYQDAYKQLAWIGGIRLRMINAFLLSHQYYPVQRGLIHQLSGG